MALEALGDAFIFINLTATAQITASAALILASGDQVTLRAGGPGIRSAPRPGPLTDYEVLLSGQPPRFWTKYASTTREILFAHVPPLLITHYIARSGGVASLELTTEHRARSGIMSLRVSVPEGAEQAIDRALSMVAGAHLVSSSFTLTE